MRANEQIGLWKLVVGCILVVLLLSIPIAVAASYIPDLEPKTHSAVELQKFR